MQEENSVNVQHPLIRPGTLESRPYQLKLADKSLSENTLVCLPTGLGKTAISLLVTVHRLNQFEGKSLLLAPTKPLVHQHATDYRNWLNLSASDIVSFTGEIPPKQRSELWDRATIIVSTPQVIQNDLIGGRISLKDVVHCTFDECHRATGNYAYTYISERYVTDASNPLSTGLSASPGNDIESILAVCNNLSLSQTEILTEEDAEVAPFAGKTNIEWVRVNLSPEAIEIRNLLRNLMKKRLSRMKSIGISIPSSNNLSERDLQQLRSQIQSQIDAGNGDGYEALSLHAELRKIKVGINYVETQSVDALKQYLERQKNASRTSGASKAAQRFISDPLTQQAKHLAKKHQGLHPKFETARVLIAEELGIVGGTRVIIFTESRDTADSLTEFLSPTFSTERFVGQTTRDGSSGMTQKQQHETISKFKNGDFNVLVSTSVAEEGLDIPDVDLVIFFEPVPTAIRTIQRRGRTGRGTHGKVVVIIANDTRDETYFWISRKREQQMHNELRSLKSSIAKLNTKTFPTNPLTPAQPKLTDFTTTDSSQKIEIVIDQRELNSSITKQLSSKENIQIKLETLAVGDYILSDRVAVERKTIDDFLDTLVGADRSLFDQVKNLSQNYSRPLVILEGEGSLYSKRNIHPNAIRGALASLAINFGASVLRTSDEDDTAQMLELIARREQISTGRSIQIHGSKSQKTLSEQQEYVVSSMAEIGPITAQLLLSHFGTVEAIMSASEDQLQQVKGVGKITAERIKKITSSSYPP